MAPVRIQLLGPLRVTRGDRVTTKFRTQKTAALLGYLAYHLGRPHRREDLIGLLWPDHAPAQARNSLSQAISSLRHELELPEEPPGSVLVADRHAVALEPSSVEVDVDSLRKAIQAQEPRGLGLYAAPLLLGLSEPWIETERFALHDRFVSAAELVIAQLEGMGDLQGAVRLALRWLESEPSSGPAARTAVRLLLLQGRPQDARVAYRDHERGLRSLGLKPTQDIQTLVEGIPDIDRIPHPKRRGPDPRVVDKPPAPLLFGRDELLERLEKAIEQPGGVLTLVGPGGVGKTRLAEELLLGRSGWFVPVAEARTHDDVVRAIAAVLGIPESAGVDPVEQIMAHLAHHPGLLVLDNYEQLVGEDDAVALVDHIARTATKIVVTSRRRLGLPSESDVPITPLLVPDRADPLEVLLKNPSVALFVERACAIRPDFRLTDENAPTVAELCQALEGLPLAIELAAARVQVLSPRQMLDHLDNRLDTFKGRGRDPTARHHSLRNAIAWSYDLLPEHLARFFAGLSVFRGGWTLEAAQDVLAEPLALDYLAELHDFSLIVSEETPGGHLRFRMLETLHAFSSELLDDPTPLEEAHRNAFVAFAEQAEPFLTTSQQRDRLQRLEDDQDNLRAAMDRRPDPMAGLRFAAALWRFWHLRGHVNEGRQRTEVLLAPFGDRISLESDDGTRLLARARHGAGRLAYLQGDYPAAEEHFELARIGFKRTQDMAGLGLALSALGSIAFEEGDYPRARAYFRGALAIARVLGDDFHVGAALNWLGIVYTDTREYDLARDVLTESLAVRGRIGDRGGIARALNSLGIIARQLGDLEQALDYYQQALAIQREVGDRRAEAGLLSNLGLVAAHTGMPEVASERFEQAMTIHREVGDKWGIATVTANLGNLAVESGDPERGEALLCESLALRQSIGNSSGIALSFEGLAVAAARRGFDERALMLLLAADRLRAEIGSPRAPDDQTRTEHERTALIRKLGPAAAGLAVPWPLHEAIRFALEAPTSNADPRSRS